MPSQNFHTPIVTAVANLISRLNAVFADLDQGITDSAADITTNTADIATNTADIATNTASITGKADVVPGTVQGRLTLSSTLAVTTSDVTAATTLYYLPYRGETVALYDGVSAWAYHNLPGAGVSISLPTPGSDTNYDVYLYDNASTLTLELVAWTDATTRATALATQDGVYVKTGATDRRYLGFIRVDTSGECQDADAGRWVANYYHRVRRGLLKQFSGSHSLSSTTLRAWNNDSTNQVTACVHGDGLVNLRHHGLADTQFTLLDIGVDSSSAGSCHIVSNVRVDASGGWGGVVSEYADYEAEGYHSFTGLEKVTAAGTATVFGSAGSGIQFGLIGDVWA